jgi:pyruvate dehydrogenase E2 component (dihydrolipoamide acetyltransferase)
MLRILVNDGETADLGAPIAIVGEAGEDAGAAEAAPAAEEPEQEAPRAEPATAEAVTEDVVAAPAASTPNGKTSGDLKVSPIARKMADQAGIDLLPMAGRGSGPEGRIVKADVERLISGGGVAAPQAPAAAPQAPAAPAAPADGEVRQLSPMLKAVAQRMAQSKSTVPHFYVESEIDMTRALEMRAELNAGLEATGEKLSVNDLILRACALALIEHPQAHRSYVDGTHVYHAHANIGIAVALDDGLIVPVVREADTKTVRQLAVEARDLAVRARDGKLKQREIEGGTFTVSNLGMLDVANFEAIINPPESAILAVGATGPRPVVVDGQIAVRQIMRVTLSCDHRACSGADGARLLQTIKRYLQAPSLLLA